MKIKFNKNTIVCFSFFLLTISGSQYCVGKEIDSYIECIVYGVLLFGIFRYFLKEKRFNIKSIFFAIFILLCFCSGILLNDLSLQRTLILLFTMIVLWSFIFIAGGYVDTYELIRKISYSVLYGVLASFILAKNGEYPCTTTSEGIGSFVSAFNGGIQYKNYFAADMLIVFIGLYVYRRDFRKKQIDLLFMLISFLLLLSSGSRGGYILFAVFLCSINIEKVKEITATQRKIFICALFMMAIIAFVILYKKIALNSETYMYRIRGILNYLTYYEGDAFHMLFGNSEKVYDQKMSYVYTVRSIAGWDGTLEFSWLDIIIKNGLIGAIGYVLVFIYFIAGYMKEENWKNKSLIISIIAVMLCSSLVETYIQSVHAVFGVYGYLILSGIRNKGVDKIDC